MQNYKVSIIFQFYKSSSRKTKLKAKNAKLQYGNELKIFLKIGLKIKIPKKVQNKNMMFILIKLKQKKSESNFLTK